MGGVEKSHITDIGVLLELGSSHKNSLEIIGNEQDKSNDYSKIILVVLVLCISDNFQ